MSPDKLWEVSNLADQIRKMTCLTATVDDRPGILAETLKALAEANINMLGVWGYPISGGKGRIMGIPQDAEKLKALAAQKGVELEESIVFVIEGDDRVGALVEPTRKIAEAGINIYAATALAAGNRFTAAIWVNPDDVTRTAQLLGV